MKRLRALTLGVGVVASACVLMASSVIPPTFSELVRESETVFVGEVLSVSAHWVDRQGRRMIVTSVTFKSLQTLKGVNGPQRVLQFEGGRMEATEIRVEGVPRFSVGDRSVLFVEPIRGPMVSPLVGLMWGRFPVSTAPDGNNYVLQHDGSPFPDVTRIGPLTTAVSTAPIVPMLLERFSGAVLDEIRRRR